MGSCATLLALDAGAFQRLCALPPPEQDPFGVAESLLTSVEYDPAVVIARWRDDADNDLSRIARGERRGLPAGVESQLLAPLLGLEGTRPSLPWWVTALFPLDANEVGLVTPVEARRLHEAVRSSGLLEALAPSLARLDAFLDQAAARGCWILGYEGHS